MEAAFTQFKLSLRSDMGTDSSKSPPTPLFPTVGAVSAAQGLLRYVMNTPRNPYEGEPRSATIDVDSAYALYDTITHTASSVGEIINASLPATRPPPEILAAIFSLVPRAYENPLNTSHFPQRSYAVTRADDLRPITEVCRYWRQVALHTPSLWSAVAEAPPKDADFYCRAPFWHYYIHRCISGPLYVDVNACVSEETLAFLGQHRNRVRELSVTGNSKRVLDDDNLLALSIPLPNVEHCQITDSYFARCLIPGSRPVIALRILGGSCARLRCLVLWNVVFIPSNTFPSLTSFTFCLHNQPGYYLETPELWTNLLEFLSKSPALRTVGIFNVACLAPFPKNREWKPLQDKIQLQDLRELNLQDHTYWDGVCGHGRRYEPNVTVSKYRSGFLGAIHIPPTCRIHLGLLYHPLDMLAVCAPLPSFGWGIPTIARIVSRVDNEAKILSVETSDLDAPELEQIHLHVDIDAPWVRLPDSNFSSLPVFAGLRELWIDADVYAAFIRVDGPGCAFNLAEFANLEILVICRGPQGHDDPAEDPHFLPAFQGHPQPRPTLATARGILKPLEVSVDVVESASAMDGVNEAGYVHELAASRAAAGCPIFRLLIGVIFRADFPPKAYVVSQYDAEGQLTSVGDHEADGLAEHWRKRMPVE